MVELYRVLGNEVRNHFSDLRVAQISQIEAQLAEVDGGKGFKARQPEEQKSEIISTNINPKGANAKEKSALKQKSEMKPIDAKTSALTKQESKHV